MSMTYSDHFCTNFQPENNFKYSMELQEALCKELDKYVQALQIAKDALEKISLGESEMISTEDLWPWAENKALEALKDVEKVMG